MYYTLNKLKALLSEIAVRNKKKLLNKYHKTNFKYKSY